MTVENDMISRSALLKNIKRAYCADCNSYNGVRCRACATGDALDMIEDAPAVDALALPCKVGDTVHVIGDVIGEKRVIRCSIDEAYLDYKKGPEFLVSFDCDNDCDGCPFNRWNQEYYSEEYFCEGEYGQASIKGDDFGKTVFMTREEAEAALADMERKAGAE